MCIQLSGVPSGGLEVYIVVDISTKDNTATSNNTVNKTDIHTHTHTHTHTSLIKVHYDYEQNRQLLLPYD